MRKVISCLLCLLVMIMFLGLSSPASSSCLDDCARKAVQPELLEILLSLVGMETEIVNLNRGDCLERGIYIKGIQDVTLLIGFPKDGIRKGVPFLLSVEETEVLVELSEGGLNVIDGEEGLVPLGIGDFIECIFDVASELLENIGECGVNPFCIVGAALSGVFNILGCIFYIL